MLVSNNRFKIKTPNGYVKFAGIAQSTHNDKIVVRTDKGSITCSPDHLFFTYNNDLIKADDILIGYDLKTEDGIAEVVDVVKTRDGDTIFYDIIEVENRENSFFLSNGVKSHNCQFLTFEKTLIEPDILDFYKLPETIEEIMGFEIYKDKFTHTDGLMIITIDPSGGGEDNSVIQIWEIAPRQVIQIASYSSPDADASVLFEKILWLQDFMRKKWHYEPDESLLIFERNGVGEGLAQILTQTEQAIEYLEIPIYYDNKGKAGVHTGQTAKNKLALQFKNLVEYNKMVINDKEFIDELYGFVRTGNGSYAGKSGYHDDRVMASFLLVHYLMNVFADFAQGDFSVDNMMLVKPEEKIANTDKEEHDPAVLYRERMKKAEEEEKKKIELEMEEARKKEEREMWARQAAMGSSVIEDEDDEDWDPDEWDILPSQSL
jgi:hypothetical protein